MKNVNSDIAYVYVRKRILAGVYRPGQPLMTKDLSAEIGVSRTPVRDALRQLEADGLVIIRAHLGASVKTMDFREYREMCGLRLALESYAAGLAAENRTMDELREMKLALEAMRRLTEQSIAAAARDQNTVDELRKEDVRFHIAIISAANSELLKKEVLRLHIVSRVVSGPTPLSGKGLLEKAADDRHKADVQVSHDAIYAALERGNGTEAKLAMERHIQDIIDANIRIMAQSEHRAVTRELSEEELSYSA